MRRFVLISLLAFALGARAGRAEPFTISLHEASGSGTANVFDGGPPVFREDQTSGDTDPTMSFLALDRTMPGSLGASASASGNSEMVQPVQDDSLTLRVDLLAAYFPSGFPGGDNPGGEAEAQLSSVIEFVMPVDELRWLYFLDIDEGFPFAGSTSVVVENITRSETLLDLTFDLALVDTILMGEAGDVIRITSQMAGSGSMGPGSSRKYYTSLFMRFDVPEPESLAILLAGALGVCAKRRRGGSRIKQ